MLNEKPEGIKELFPREKNTFSLLFLFQWGRISPKPSCLPFTPFAPGRRVIYYIGNLIINLASSSKSTLYHLWERPSAPQIQSVGPRTAGETRLAPALQVGWVNLSEAQSAGLVISPNYSLEVCQYLGFPFVNLYLTS